MTLLDITLGVESEKKKNYAMVKLATPKRVTLPNGRTFIARYKRIKRSELPLHIVIRRTYTQRAALLAVEEGEEEGSNRDRAFLIL